MTTPAQRAQQIIEDSAEDIIDKATRRVVAALLHFTKDCGLSWDGFGKDANAAAMALALAEYIDPLNAASSVVVPQVYWDSAEVVAGDKLQDEFTFVPDSNTKPPRVVDKPVQV